MSNKLSINIDAPIVDAFATGSIDPHDRTAVTLPTFPNPTKALVKEFTANGSTALNLVAGVASAGVTGGTVTMEECAIVLVEIVKTASGNCTGSFEVNTNAGVNVALPAGSTTLGSTADNTAAVGTVLRAYLSYNGLAHDVNFTDAFTVVLTSPVNWKLRLTLIGY